MTVLYIIDYGTIGGATTAFISMLKQMIKYGVRPVVVTSSYSSLNIELEKYGAITIVAGHYNILEPFNFRRLKWPLILIKYLYRYYIHERKAVKNVSSSIDFSKIDLIHSNSNRLSLGCTLSKLYKIPHVLHLREFGDKDFGCISLKYNYINFFNKNSNAFIAISRAVYAHWMNKGIDQNKMNLIYDGVYEADIDVSEDDRKFETVLKMVIVGGVYPTKGQHIAVEAISLLPLAIRNRVTLDIIGWSDSKYVEDIKKNAEDKGIKEQISFLGARTDVHQLLKNYHIGLMCSRSEGFGLVTAEYMHAKLGVIASNTGASVELIKDGEDGLNFKEGDSMSLSQKITTYYNDRLLLVQHSNQAYNKAKSCYTAEINAQNIFRLYNRLIQCK